jgi:hypothetical protein
MACCKNRTSTDESVEPTKSNERVEHSQEVCFSGGNELLKLQSTRERSTVHVSQTYSLVVDDIVPAAARAAAA